MRKAISTDIAFRSLRLSQALYAAKNGLSLTHEDSYASYAIIRHNIRTYQSGGVVEVLRGKRDAEAALKKLEDFQNSMEQHQGWRYFIERSRLKAGTDPAEATHFRQSDLEAREAKALQEPGIASE